MVFGYNRFEESEMPNGALWNASGFSRRRLLQAVAANMVLPGATTKHQVGVARNSNPYDATRKAIEACGQ